MSDKSILTTVALHISKSERPLDEATIIIGGAIEALATTKGESAARQLLSALAAAQPVSPVAWLIEHDRFAPEVELYRPGVVPVTAADRSAGFTARPLYPAPPHPTEGKNT